MSDIKNIGGDAALKVNELRAPEQAEQELARSGKFQGANVNAVSPPAESPLGVENSGARLNATRVPPPAESPNLASAPTNDQLFDYAVGNSQEAGVRDYLQSDPAASRAVSAIARGNREIGDIDREPQLDQSVLRRLDEIAKGLFRS